MGRKRRDLDAKDVSERLTVRVRADAAGRPPGDLLDAVAELLIDRGRLQLGGGAAALRPTLIPAGLCVALSAG